MSIADAIYQFALPNHFLLFFGIVNLIFGMFALLPIPPLDGAVIWHELRNWNPA
jgi:membrane-associated protease RseP (regulator of RpoE activity)